jgi:hypothetical protein
LLLHDTTDNECIRICSKIIAANAVENPEKEFERKFHMPGPIYRPEKGVNMYAVELNAFRGILATIQF